MAYRYASVVQLTMDDPRNQHMNEGDIILIAGKQDEYSYSVLGPDDFVDVECEVLGVVGPSDQPMGKNEVTKWAADQDKARELAGLEA